MKKAIYSLLTIFLIAGGAYPQRTIKPVSQVNNAVTNARVDLTAPTTGAEPGANFTFAATVSDTTGLGVIAYQFDLHYDPTVIRPQANAVSVAGTISSNLSAVYNPISPGILKVAVYGAYPLTGSGALIKFNFVAIGEAGSVSPLKWVNPMFNEGNPAVYSVNGQIRITWPTSATRVDFTGKESAAGTLDFMNHLYRANTFVMTSNDVSNATSLTASFDMMVTDEANYYKIPEGRWTMMVYEAGSYVGSVFGDVYEGRVYDQVDGNGNMTVRTIESRLRIKGGIGRYAYLGVEEIPSGEYRSVTNYTNQKSTTATFSFVL